MAVKFSNNFSTVLVSSISSSATVIELQSVSGLPTLAAGDHTYLTFDTDTNSPTIEIVKVTAINAGTNEITVVRGQDNTSASAFAAGTAVELRMCAILLSEFLQQDGDGSNLQDVRAETVEVNVKNVSGGPLAKGTPVHQTGTSGATTFEVVAADASNAALMPAHFVLLETLADEEEGRGLLMGRISGVNTSAFSEGDTIYVAVGGGYTNSAPTGEGNLIQNLGTVTRVDATNGGGEVMGAGRSNATPNLNEGNIFLGNASNQAVTASLSTSVQNLSHYNNANWDTAYGWGNHASAGYLTSFTETDPVFSASAASGISSTNITNWNTAYGWGNHASAGYLTGNQTITLTGDVSGSGTTSIAVTIADDSHNHVISNVDGLQAALDVKLGISANAVSASKWATARTITLGGVLSGSASIDGSANVTLTAAHTSDPVITLTGAVTGSGTMTNLGSVSIATTATADPTLTLTGDVTGSATFTNLGNATLTATVANDSHTHDGRYYTESEIDTRIDNNTLYATDALNSTTNLDDVTDNGFYRWTSSAPTNNPSGNYHNMIVQTDGGQPTQLVWGGSGNGGADLHIRRRDSGTWVGWTEFLNSSTQFSGDVSGTYNSIVVADDSHNHVISNVDGLQTALDAKVDLAGDTMTGSLGVGIAPAFRLHAYHPTTNVVARFESGDTDVWIDLHDSNSGTYGALIGHNSTDHFMITAGNANPIFKVSATGVADANSGYRVNGTTVIDSSREGSFATRASFGGIDSAGNVQPSANNTVVSGYGMIGNRGTYYITNGGGVIQIGNGSVHNNNPTATFSTTALNLGSGRSLKMNGTNVINASRQATFDSVEGTRVGVNNTSSTTKHGFSLYGGYSQGTNPTYGIMFTGTSGSGQHGSVTGDWATYFTMDNSAGRGWIFRDQSSAANVASISNAGHLTATRLYPGDGNDGFFYSDIDGRTAFANGDFYIQSSVDDFYNYATNQYYGAASGDNIYFRGNSLSGDGWSLNGAGTFSGNGLIRRSGVTFINAVDGATYLYPGNDTTVALTLQSGRTIAPTLAIGQVNAYTDVITSARAAQNLTSVTLDAGSGNGYCFWDSTSNYKIYMAAQSDAADGGRVSGETSSDYNMYFKMRSGTNRGFVFRDNANNYFSINPNGVYSEVPYSDPKLYRPYITASGASPNDDQLLTRWRYADGDTYYLDLNQRVTSAQLRWAFSVKNGSSTWADRLVFKNANVGIGGLQDPAYTLDVNGAVNVVGGYHVNGTTVIDASRNITANDTSVGGLTVRSSTNDCLNFDGGSAGNHRGIAFNSRTALSADVSDGWLRLNSQSEFTNGVFTPGNMQVDGHLDVSQFIRHVSDTNTYITFPAADDMQLVAGGRQMIRMDEGTNPDRLYFPNGSSYTDSNGDAVFAGNVTAYASDRRLKTRIKPIENALAKVMAIRGVTYDWIEGVEDLGFVPGRKNDCMGVIAQELEEAGVDQVIMPAPFDRMRSKETNWEDVSRSGEEYKTVDYDKLTALLIEAVKEQQTQINALQAKIEELENGNH